MLSKKGAGLEASTKTNLGITAQTLWHLDILLQNTIEVNYLEMYILIPSPEAFVLHKMIINKERNDKMLKDQSVINKLYNFIDLEKFDKLKISLSKKEKS